MAKGTASLFHPKPSRPTLPKKDSPSTNTPSPGPSQSTPGTPKKAATPATRTPQQQARRPVAPLPKPKAADDDKKQAPPEGPYAEFRLMSSKLNGWKYDVMKFESRKRIDINTWAAPVKLNRKEPRREDAPDAASQQAVSAMVGSDGKLVIGADGKVVMVDAAGRPVRAPVDADEAGEEKGKGKDKKKRFVKKTRQVFLVPEETRQLRREERHPWVMEDAKHEETWVGKMEEVAKSQTYAMFMPAADDVFKFVTAHRWYKFQKKPHYHIPNLEEAESLMTKMQKHKDTHWTLRQRTEQTSGGSSLVHSASTSLGPGGRKLRTVDNGPSELFGDDDEDGGDSKRKTKRELGAEGDLDELDFEDTFADDEEKMDLDDKEDDETKELEERLKKEYKNANKLREGHIDESDEEEEEAQLTGAGKNLQKTLKKLDKDGAYDDSDDEKNPYASEEEEEEEEVPFAPTGPAIQPVEPKPNARSASQTSPVVQAGKPTANGQPPSTPKTTEPLPQSISRPTSPAPAPGHGGHSVVARRATSPKMPKLKTAIPSRAGSPLASPNGASPPASRATSPTAGSPPPAPSAAGGAKALKRKATDDGSAGAAGGAPGSVPRPKKRKAQLLPGAELEDRMVIDWLRATPGATTRECILHFTPYLTDEEKKNKFTALVKEVAQLSKGVLVLRPAYRGAAASPAAG
ncbi:Transcription initiation factor IIF subunit alpha [Trametes pubescens]|uniref:Transcription initiation factor IIF subunit alpha n=1 Tax=Trametes pubescens TaxID=154538 RepID=A0A1M2V7Y8_TRAPU|nr:Transcription initiation factor IIF subunit alpha [Trametes pubescens]